MLDEASVGVVGAGSDASTGAGIASEKVDPRESESVSEVLLGGSVDPATLLRSVFFGARRESDRHIRIASKNTAPCRSIANIRSQEALFTIETGPALGSTQELSQFESPSDLSVLPLLLA